MQGGCKEEPAYSFRRACPAPLQTELCQWPLGKTTQSAVNRGFTTHKLLKALSVLPLNQSTFWVRTLFGGFQSHLAFSSRVHFGSGVFPKAIFSRSTQPISADPNFKSQVKELTRKE